MQKELTNKINNIQIVTNCCDILIKSSAVLVPVVKYTSNFLLSYENNKAIIEEKIDNSSECIKENNEIVMQSLKKANTILLNNNVVIVNGKIVKGAICPISNLERANDILEVYVPTKSAIKYCVSSIGGDINAYGIHSPNFKIKTICGLINLMNITSKSLCINSNSSDVYLNSVESNNININSISGSIDIEMDDNRSNYILENHTSHGNIDIDSYDIDSYYDRLAHDVNKKIYVDTFSGDIDIMFRGRR